MFRVVKIIKKYFMKQTKFYFKDQLIKYQNKFTD